MCDGGLEGGGGGGQVFRTWTAGHHEYRHALVARQSTEDGARDEADERKETELTAQADDHAPPIRMRSESESGVRLPPMCSPVRGLEGGIDLVLAFTSHHMILKSRWRWKTDGGVGNVTYDLICAMKALNEMDAANPNTSMKSSA